MAVRVEIDLNENMLEALTVNASREGLSLASFIERILRDSLGRTTFGAASEAGKFLSLSHLAPQPPFDFKTFDEIIALDKNQER